MLIYGAIAVACSRTVSRVTPSFVERRKSQAFSMRIGILPQIMVLLSQARVDQSMNVCRGEKHARTVGLQIGARGNTACQKLIGTEGNPYQ